MTREEATNKVDLFLITCMQMEPSSKQPDSILFISPVTKRRKTKTNIPCSNINFSLENNVFDTETIWYDVFLTIEIERRKITQTCDPQFIQTTE